ncbi:MAG: Type IV pilin [Parcubacteria group bacterium GW2011_GWC2_39_14]|nr:MAG: Type IV pilin [Parcubacteria group bacterium GW2011_GWC2_39_14]KKR55441.1 MAG: Type IV pilin [Parcubacteria group bacterium GW2011_GWA2_40_23]
MKQQKVAKQTLNQKSKKARKQIYFGGVSKKAVLFFTKNLSIMLKTGSTLSEALRVINKQTKGKFHEVLIEIISKVEQGHKFSEALTDHPKVFTNIYISIVKIGEESGTLDKNLEYLSEQLEKNYKLKKQIIGAMIYPMIILGGTLILGIMISLFVLPKLTKMFKNFRVELPLTTRILIAFSDFFENHGVLAVSILLGGLIALFFFFRLKQIKPYTHRLILHIPLLSSFSKNYSLSMFYRSLSILLKSGSTIDEGIIICSQTVSNVHYKKIIEEIYGKIKTGENLFDLLDQHHKLFPPTDTQVINVGEESGTLADSLAYIASIREDELNDLSKNLSTMLEPILFIFLGLIVAVLALSIITPIYSITQSFN